MLKPVVCFILFSLLLIAGCSDNVSQANPTASTPSSAVYPLIGYWEAVQCEGMCVDEDPWVHAVSFRRDGSFCEYDSVLTSHVTIGTYDYENGSLVVTIPNASGALEATWHCEVGVDTMTWYRCASESPPAWVFVRSTAF